MIREFNNNFAKGEYDLDLSIEKLNDIQKQLLELRIFEVENFNSTLGQTLKCVRELSLIGVKVKLWDYHYDGIKKIGRFVYYL